MKKICSWLLVLAMLVTWLPAGALAAGIETGETGRIRPEVQGERSLSELGLRDRAAQTLEQPQLAEDQIVDIIVLLDDSRLTATPSAGVRQALPASSGRSPGRFWAACRWRWGIPTPRWSMASLPL